MRYRSRKDRIESGALDPSDLQVSGMQDIELAAGLEYGIAPPEEVSKNLGKPSPEGYEQEQ